MASFNFFKNKRILITGHTGFKGAWLTCWLHKLGAKVLGYSKDSPHKNGVFEITAIKEKITDIRGDIRDFRKVKQVFDDFQPEIVFHLAAQPIVIESYRNPIETIQTNTMGTVNILEAIRQTTSVRVGIMVSTDKCYENKEWTWGYRENEPMGGHDTYSASKGAAEILISSYRRSFFSKNDLPEIASVRAGNVIGGGDWSKYRLIPDVIRAIQNNDPVKLRNPMATRPWQFVLEPLGGYLLLALLMYQKPAEYSEAWNFGPNNNDSYSVSEVVNGILQRLNFEELNIDTERNELHEASNLTLDISKAKRKLGWKPILEFSETLELTTDWYFSSSKEEITYDQIGAYEEKWNSLRKT